MKHSAMVAAATRLMKARKPFIVFGPPGGGKTAGLVQATQLAEMRCIITHPVIQEEVDWRGLPGFVTDRQGETRAMFLPFGFLRELTEDGPPTACIVDDVGQARMSVQASLMQAVHLREVDGVAIRDNVTWALASNRREDKAAVTGMVSALLDRMVTALELKFDHNELAQYLIVRGYEPLVAAFIRTLPQVVDFDVKDEFKKQPTPRSIEGFAQLLEMGETDLDVLSGAAGASFATQYLSYAKVEKKLPTLEQIVKDPHGAHVPEEKDVLYALAASLAGRLEKKTLAPGIEYLSRCPPEFAVMAMKDLVKKCPDIGGEQAFKVWSRKNLKLLGM